MLFNSYSFLFVFLPITFLGFFFSARSSQKIAAIWLGLASVFFYSWWDWRFTFILFASILINFFFGIQLHSRKGNSKLLLSCAVSLNLLTLAYFKYMNFFVLSFVAATGIHLEWQAIALPIGISFYTFTQIAFLVDTAQGKAEEAYFPHYLLFVTYFPHLIAGPILHHSEMMPQFAKKENYSLRADSVAIGITIFSFGLFKKVMLADSISRYADYTFSVATGSRLNFLTAWIGALAYAMQIYFDFSGYTDMAIGISRLFNIRLPANFDSPYKSKSIVDFWRRWHMTLSRFLRDYLYVPLGGNRNGQINRYINLLLTMALGGLWHGAGWTYLVWGLLHGTYLMVNHAFQLLKISLHDFLSWALTFLSVLVAWIFFRAPNFAVAMNILRTMFGARGIVLPNAIGFRLHFALDRLASLGIHFADISFGDHATLPDALTWLLPLLGIALFLPNLHQVMEKYWRPNLLWALPTLSALLVSLYYMTRISQFLYFQF